MGIQVWRVQDSRPNMWPPKNHGIFLSSSCFIVLHVSKDKDGSPRHEVRLSEGDALEYGCCCVSKGHIPAPGLGVSASLWSVVG